MQHPVFYHVFPKTKFMNKIILSVVCMAVSLFSFAQNKMINDPNAQSRTATGFHAVKISHGIDLYLSQGNEEAVAVSASNTNYRDKIKTEVENGVLKIYLENEHGFSWNSGNHKLKAYVSFKMLDELTASGGSDVFFESEIAVEKLNINLSGGSDLKKGLVKINDLSLNQSGGSDVNLSGTVINLKVVASGGSDLKGFDLVTDICDVQASGGSDTHITVNKELNINASGGSDVHYRGNGVVKELRSSGSSSVSKRS
jgi:putative autotransporter adhesin-like protein